MKNLITRYIDEARGVHTLLVECELVQPLRRQSGKLSEDKCTDPLTQQFPSGVYPAGTLTI